MFFLLETLQIHLVYVSLFSVLSNHQSLGYHRPAPPGGDPNDHAWLSVNSIGLNAPNKTLVTLIPSQSTHPKCLIQWNLNFAHSALHQVPSLFWLLLLRVYRTLATLVMKFHTSYPPGKYANRLSISPTSFWQAPSDLILDSLHSKDSSNHCSISTLNPIWYYYVFKAFNAVPILGLT